MKQNLSLSLRTSLLVAIAISTACSTGAPKRTQLMADLGVEDMTQRELQVVVYGISSHCAGVVELAAQSIQNSASSPEVKQNAILWKVNAIPAIYGAAFSPDPLGALASLWGFTIQMRVFFTTGPGKDTFGAWQEIAVKASEEIEASAEGLARRVIPEEHLAEVKSGIEEYHQSHPIENMLFVRSGEPVKFLSRVAGSSEGGLAAAASMNEEMQALSDRMALLTVSVPKQVQWQAELMMAQAPPFIDEERDSTIAILEKETIEMLKPLMLYIEEMREEVTKDVAQERIAVMQGIASERIAVLEALVEERNVVLERIGEERNLTIEQIGTLMLSTVEQMVDDTGQLSEKTADHIFFRTVQLLALPFLGLAVFCVILLLIIRNGINRYLKILAEAKGVDRSRTNV